mmetsp:Transcript_25667/g.59813  ORF Transcript_25667/g.59813 Transcript_25667/m.59813 type:complete len:171 (+) Transcript_25667:97-609(+)|eukprot:CAMPEP_0178459170 /NCGR_PEP_ID=MMETSP0689_2-20121128/47967_1 /TAXON_ID=160604 /ORGANISM="Amphidinium massartii, Strain CS-259" /LENGTH=170 /DNA_ID=CAMNT_0020085589 /DNA_START=96 /DNA_END=608 /DNA_ORIENTATION=+
MAEKDTKAPEEAADDAETTQDIFYVCKKTLGQLKEKVKKGEDISKELVNELTFPENLGDDEVMVPVDMRGVGEEFEDVEQMIEKLGPKGTAEAFIKAAEYFEANPNKEPEDERPKEMSAKEWRKVLEDEEELEEELPEGEEEELLEEELEEECEDDGEAAGPPAKKAKTA